MLNRALTDQVELSFMKQANDLQTTLTGMTARVGENPAEFETAAAEFFNMANDSALPVKTKYKLIIEGKRAIAKAAVEGRIAENPAGVSRDLLNGVYKDYLTVEDAKALAKQADEDDFYISLQYSPALTLKRLDAQKDGRYTDFPTFDEKDRAGFRKTIKGFDGKKKTLMANGYSEYEAKQKSLSHLINKQAFSNQWKTAEKGGLYGVLEYRDKLLQAYKADGVSDNDYAELIAKTVQPLLKQSVKKRLPIPLNAFERVAKSVFKNADLKSEGDNDEVKAALFDRVYDEFKKAGISPVSSYSDNREKLEEITKNIVSDYADLKTGGVFLDTVHAVLTTTGKINLDEGKTVQPARYKVYEDKDGNRWKVYKDKDGGFSTASVMQRIF